MSEHIVKNQHESRKKRSLRKAGAYTGIILANLLADSPAFASTYKEPQPPGLEQALKTQHDPKIDKLISKIKIMGDKECELETKTSLNLLAHNVPAYFRRVIRYIGVIDCESGGTGMYAYEDPPRFVVGDKQRAAGIYWYASVIVHDATHSKLYHDYLNQHPGKRVPDKVWIGRRAEDICNGAQEATLKNIGAPEYYENYYLDYLNKIRNLPYWDVLPGERP